jgi:hypothetical protein
MQSNPFGAAKPREAVLSQRTGVDEKDILKSEALKYAPTVHTRPLPRPPSVHIPSRPVPFPLWPLGTDGASALAADDLQLSAQTRRLVVGIHNACASDEQVPTAMDSCSDTQWSGEDVSVTSFPLLTCTGVGVYAAEPEPRTARGQGGAGGGGSRSQGGAGD